MAAFSFLGTPTSQYLETPIPWKSRLNRSDNHVNAVDPKVAGEKGEENGQRARQPRYCGGVLVESEQKSHHILDCTDLVCTAHDKRMRSISMR